MSRRFTQKQLEVAPDEVFTAVEQDGEAIIVSETGEPRMRISSGKQIPEPPVERAQILEFIRSTALYWYRQAQAAGKTQFAASCEGKAGVLDGIAIDIENNQHKRGVS